MRFQIASPELETAAAKAGVGAIENAPLGGLTKFHVPFSGMLGIPEISSAPFLTGPRSQAVARGMDVAGQALRTAPVIGPIGRQLGALFNQRGTGGALGRFTQEAHGEFGQAARDAEEMAARSHSAELAQGMDPLFEGVAKEAKQQAEQLAADPSLAGRLPPNVQPRDINNAIRSAAEGTLMQLPKQMEATGLGQLPGQINAESARQIAQAKEWGMPVAEHESRWGNRYVHRESTNAYPGELQLGAGDRPKGKHLPTTTGSSLQRETAFDVPGGTSQVNEIMRELAGMRPGEITPGGGFGVPSKTPGGWASGQVGTKGGIAVQPKLGNTVLQDIRGRLEQTLVDRGEDPALWKNALDRQARSLAKKVARTPEAYRGAEAQPFFNEAIAETERTRGMQHARQLGNTQTLIGAIGKAAEKLPPGMTPEMAQAAGWTRADKALQQVGLRSTPFSTGQEEFLQHGPQPYKPWGENLDIAPPVPVATPAQGAAVQLHKKLAPKGTGVTGELIHQPKAIEKEVSQFWVRPEHFQDIAQNYAKWQMPEQLKQPAEWFNSLNNLWKGMVYPFWPASHVHNAVTAFINNSIATGNPLQALGDIWQQSKVMRGTARGLGRIPGVIGATPAEELASLRKLQASAGIGTGEGLMSNEIAGAANAVQSGLRPALPGVGYTGKTGTIAGDIADLYANQGMWGTARMWLKLVATLPPGKGSVNPLKKISE